jgi:hypothetical protein
LFGASLKASVVDAELAKLDLKLRAIPRAARIVSPAAYEAGETAGASLAINPEIRGPSLPDDCNSDNSRRNQP